jgi:hypothetical protein
MIDALAWDPEMESPATIAILGAGPLGIETALYARFLGYHISIFETRRVAHRMLDWNLRPLEEPASNVTTSLGLAALQAQDPTYRPPDPSRVFNGKQYAEEYLLPLAKTDLLFDDIHFLSPVIDISRFRVGTQPLAGRFDEYPWQERCNDEFRILVDGRHRGTWVSRADCIIDCRGHGTHRVGLGPAGGLAIGELDARKEFLEHLPNDRKFDPKTYDAQSILIVGSSQDACRTLRECLAYARHERLVWVLPYTQSDEAEFLAQARLELNQQTSSSFVMIESLGVESISPQENGGWQVRLLKEDDSSVELQVDRIASRTEPLETLLGPTLLTYNPQASNFLESGFQQYARANPSQETYLRSAREVLTPEPGYFRLRAERRWDVAFERLRSIFAILGGRSDLDLYEIMRKQQSTAPDEA